MTADAATSAKAIAVPGPSRTTEGLGRVATDAIRHAVEGLQGAAAVVRSLAR